MIRPRFSIELSNIQQIASRKIRFQPVSVGLRPLLRVCRIKQKAGVPVRHQRSRGFAEDRQNKGIGIAVEQRGTELARGRVRAERQLAFGNLAGNDTLCLEHGVGPRPGLVPQPNDRVAASPNDIIDAIPADFPGDAAGVQRVREHPHYPLRTTSDASLRPLLEMAVWAGLPDNLAVGSSSSH